MDELKSTDELTTNEVVTPGIGPVNRRLVMAGFAGIGAAALISTKLTSVQAKDSNDDDGDDEGDDEGDDDSMMDPEREAALVALYEVFLASVSAELGTADTASVDVALRNGLKAVVDQRLADGDISANSAEDRKAAIDAAVVPICIHGRGWDDDDDRGGSGGSSDDDSDESDDSDDSGDDSNEDDASDDDVTPTPKP